MRRSVFTYVLLAVLLLTGCSVAPTESPKTNLPTLEGNWQIKLAHSGGIMGLSHSIEISSNGSYTVTDERTNKTIKSELNTDELSKLTEQVESAKFTPAIPPDGFACADCFIYNLEIQSSSAKFAAELNDISLPNSGLEPLVTYLRGLIERALNS